MPRSVTDAVPRPVQVPFGADGPIDVMTGLHHRAAAGPDVSRDVMPQLDFLVVNGKVFATQATDWPLETALAELKAWYEEHYQRLKAQVEHDNYTELHEEWRRQLDHLDAYGRVNNAIIPPTLHGKPVMYFKEEVCEYRSIRYKPNEIVGGAMYVWNRLHNADGRPKGECAQAIKKVRTFEPNGKVRITLDQDMVDLTVDIIYAPKRKTIYTPMGRLYHTMSDLNVCTGNTPAEIFWKDPGFTEGVNRINLFSLATDSIVLPAAPGSLPRTIPVDKLFKDRFITKIEQEGENKWRA